MSTIEAIFEVWKETLATPEQMSLERRKKPKWEKKVGEVERARMWTYTQNNPTAWDWNQLMISKARCVKGQLERGKNGTLHIQAYVYFKDAKPKGYVLNQFRGAYVEAARSEKELMAYVWKDDETTIAGTKFLKGEEPNPGARIDMKEWAEAIVKGEKKVEDVAREAPGHFVRFHKGLEALENILRKDRTKGPEIHWLWGETGAGKTYHVFNKHGADNVYMKDDTRWWPNYKQEEAILIDDFDGWPYGDLKRLLDIYKLQVQTKGGYVKVNSPYIYITSEFPPEHWWKKGNQLKQITRRIRDSGGSIRELFRSDWTDDVVE